MHAKIEKLLSMIKAQEHNSSESYDFLHKILKELLKHQASTNKSQWITK